MGVGEATLDSAPDGFPSLLQASVQCLRGKVVEDGCLEHLRAQGLAEATVYSAIDQAVSDLSAQLDGISLWQEFGGAASEPTVDLYANINRATDDRTPAGFARSAQRAVEQGFSSLKLVPFDGLTPSLCDVDRGIPLIESGLDRISSINAAAPQADIRVDCHGLPRSGGPVSVLVHGGAGRHGWGGRRSGSGWRSPRLRSAALQSDQFVVR